MRATPLWFWGAFVSGITLGLIVGRFALMHDNVYVACIIGFLALNFALIRLSNRRVEKERDELEDKADALRARIEARVLHMELIERTAEKCPECGMPLAGKPATGGAQQ